MLLWFCWILLVLPSQPIHEYQRSFGSELDSADQGPPEGEIRTCTTCGGGSGCARGLEMASRGRSRSPPGRSGRPAPVPVCYPAIGSTLRVLATQWREGGRVEILAELLPRAEEVRDGDRRPRRVWLTAWQVAVLVDGEAVEGRWRACMLSS